ncbi:MAG: hypothetical protein Q8R07_03190 [Candidatus Uhrbacteria bacterium]|nr:hypothetical protein [Candidatus Uhrbacteria bacterium]
MKRTVGGILIFMLVGVAFLSICRYTGTSMSVTDDPLIASMTDSMMNCAVNPANCPINLQEHQTSFFQFFPAVASRIAITVVFALLALWVLLYFETPRDSFFLKPFFDRRKIFIASPMLLLAFRRGILNPKIF